MSLPAGTTWMYQGHPIRLVERENGLAGGEMVPLTETEDRVRLAHRVQRKRYSRHGDGDDGLPPEYDGLRERRIVSRDGAYDWIEYVPVRRPGTDRIVWKGTALALGLNAHDLKRMKLDKLPFGPLDGRKVPRQDPGRSPLLERLTAGDPQSHQPGKRPSDGPKLYQPEDEDETPPSRAIPAGRPLSASTVPNNSGTGVTESATPRPTSPDPSFQPTPRPVRSIPSRSRSPGRAAARSSSTTTR